MAETKDKPERQPRVVVVSPPGVAAYSYFHKPDTGKQYSDNKYKSKLVIDGDVDMSGIEKTIRAFAAEVFKGDDKYDPEELKLPWSEGDPEKEEFAGKIILTAKTKKQPMLVDSKRVKLPKSVKVFSGDVVRLVAQLYAYKKTEKVKEGKKLIDVLLFGVSLQLMTAQLIEKRSGSGNGGLDALDDIDGFDASEWATDDDEATEGDNESSDDADKSDF